MRYTGVLPFRIFSLLMFNDPLPQEAPNLPRTIKSLVGAELYPGASFCEGGPAAGGTFTRMSIGRSFKSLPMKDPYSSAQLWVGATAEAALIEHKAAAAVPGLLLP
jgi:hypothetical protein